MKRAAHLIRPCIPDDGELLSRIVRRSFADVAKRYGLTPDNCPKHPSNCRKAWIDQDFDRGVFYFILEQNQKLKGCVGLEIPEKSLGYLERLSVLPEYRNQGLGKALVRHVVREAGTKGVQRLSIGIIGWQTELADWYGRIGFRETETKTFPHLPFPVTLMALDLDSCDRGD